MRKPSCAASATRRSPWDTGRTSPPSPTSPMKMASGGRARSYTLEASATATARSPAGSCILSPPTTLRKTSSCANDRPVRLSSTASSKARRRPSSPVDTRCGVPNPALAASACTSTRIGRVPSSKAVIALPEVRDSRSPRNSADGLSTPISPDSLMRKTPISSTDPKRFLVARNTR